MQERESNNVFSVSDSNGFIDYWMDSYGLDEAIVRVASEYQETTSLLIQVARKYIGIESSNKVVEFQKTKSLGLSFIDDFYFETVEDKMQRFEGIESGYKRTRRYSFTHNLPETRSSIKVWTDGSFNYETGKAGWAWVHEKGQASGTIISESKTIVLDAELEAVRQAIYSHRDKTITIYTDSRSLINKFKVGDPIVEEFKEYSFILEWIKGHGKVFTEFNVVADYLSRNQTL